MPPTTNQVLDSDPYNPAFEKSLSSETKLLMVGDNPIEHLNLAGGAQSDKNRSSMNSDSINIGRLGNNSPTKLSVQSMPGK